MEKITDRLEKAADHYKGQAEAAQAVIEQMRDALQYAVEQVPELATVPGISAAIAKTPMPPSVPDGWVLVPVEPTMHMMHAGQMNWDYGDKATGDIWRDMIKAAPKPGEE